MNSISPEAHRQKPKRGPRLSAVLRMIAGDTGKERISVGDLVEALGHRAFGPLLLIFALPNALPAIPGTSAVLGLPLVFLAAQLMLGQVPWLPRLIAERSMPRADFAALVERIMPWLIRAQRLLKVRLPLLNGPAAHRLTGALCLALALVLLLPIPLGNMLPGLAISVIALGILGHDGLWVLAGGLIGALALTVVSGVLVAFAKAGLYLFTHHLF